MQLISLIETLHVHVEDKNFSSVVALWNSNHRYCKFYPHLMHHILQ